MIEKRITMSEFQVNEPRTSRFLVAPLNVHWMDPLKSMISDRVFRYIMKEVSNAPHYQIISAEE